MFSDGQVITWVCIFEWTEPTANSSSVQIRDQVRARGLEIRQVNVCEVT